MFPFSGFSQPYYFKHYQAENGLSYNTVSHILQDSKGLMWFGTRDGLNRFDGYTFKVYRHQEEDSTSIGSDNIYALLEDNQKQLWVGTDKGLYTYHPEEETFSCFKYTSNKAVYAVTNDHQNNLWMIANNELCFYDMKTHIFHQYKNIDNSNPTWITVTDIGEVWVSFSDGKIRRYISQEDSFSSPYDMFAHSGPSSSHHIQIMEKANENLLLIGTTNQGAKVFNCETHLYQDLITYNEDQTTMYVRDFLQTKENEYWIATESGTYIYNTVTHQYQHLKKTIDNPYALSDNAVYDLFKDREGGIWAATYFGGVNYFSKTFSNFRKYFPDLGGNSLKGNVVREICKDKYNKLWIGTEDGGLNSYDIAKKQYQNYLPTGKKESIAYSNIHGLLADGDKLWIGTFEHGLDVMDIPSKKIIKHYNVGNSPHDLKSNFIVTIIKTRNGDVLIGTTFGLYRYNPKTDDFDFLYLDKRVPFVHNLMEDHLGNIWAATLDYGIYRYDPTTGKSIHFSHHPNSNSISTNSVISAFESSDHLIWFSTYGGGLSRYDTKTNNFTTFKTENGLPSDIVFKVLEDHHKNLWITTSKGLLVKKQNSNQFRIYTTSNGLLNDQFNYNSGFIDETGNLYFGSIKGMISFNPDDFNNINFNNPLYFTGFQINNKEVKSGKDSPLKRSILVEDHIILSHKQSSFSVNFSALSYAAPEMIEYAYRMEGLTKEWTYLQTNRTVYFTELAAGDYTFTIKVANQSQKIPFVKSLHITILPPWWESWWACVIYVLSIAFIIYLVTRFFFIREKEKHHRKSILLENEKEKEIYEAKISFFTHVAHEIKTPLTLIKGPMEKLIKRAADIPEIEESLHIMDKNTERLLNLTNQLLDLRKVETHSYKLTFIKVNVSKVIADIFARFKLAAEQQNLSFDLLLPEQPVYAYVDLEAFQKISSNLFSNAIKYAASKIIVRLNKPGVKDESFEFNILNDGNLIPLNYREKIFDPFFRIDGQGKSSGTGIGLPLARFLTELHKGTLILAGVEDDMNIFELTLPLHQSQEIDLEDEEIEIDYSATYIPNEETNTKLAILLVDDHEEILDFIAGELDDKFHIWKAKNGKEALNVLENEVIQLIISDIMMPEMDGYELCSIVKTNIHFSHIPVILLTAKSTLQSKIEGLEIGADSYIEKPFSPDHLLAQVNSLLENRKKIKEYFSNSPLAHITTIGINKYEESFLEQLQKILLDNLSNEKLDVELLAEEMNMSRPTLYRKIKSISDLTPSELINITRLKKAAELLGNGEYKIYEIAEMVGYSSQTRFSRNFQKQFGASPSEYIQKMRSELHPKQ